MTGITLVIMKDLRAPDQQQGRGGFVETDACSHFSPLTSALSEADFTLPQASAVSRNISVTVLPYYKLYFLSIIAVCVV